jgi:predicted DNA-binding protein
MEVHFSPELENQLSALSARTGRSADELVQDVMAGYFQEIAELRQSLDSRYDDIKSGRVTPIDGEAFFEDLRKREEELVLPNPK